MKDKRQALAQQQFDVLVIGAGMFGACIAWSAVLRGYSVAVIDKGDFANATSSNHYKFIHGGIRYLQHLDLVRLRESSREKSALLRIAPHLACPMPIVFPTYGHGRRGKALMRAAMLAYDLLTLDKNRGIGDPARRTPAGSVISREQLLARFPGIPDAGLTGGAVFYDGQMYNPARLVLAFLRSAGSKGAVLANYVKAVGLQRHDTRITGCTAEDGISGQSITIRARMVVNAAGPWGQRLLDGDTELAQDPEQQPSFSRDLALVVRKTVSETHAIGCQSASSDSDAIIDRGGRHLFLVPWRGLTLVGVWHRFSRADPDNIAVSREELKSYLDEINAAYRGIDLCMDDIGMVNTGHILFGSASAQGTDHEHSFAKRSLLIDHALHGTEGLVSVIGARATVARGVAEKTMDLVQQKLDDRPVCPATERERIYGGHFNNFASLVAEIRQQLPEGSRHAATALAHNYGSEYAQVFNCAADATQLEPIGNSNVIAAELVHAIRHEMARTLTDIVVRRTELGSGGHPGDAALSQAAAIAGAEFGWDPQQTAAELSAAERLLRQCGPWNFVEHLAAEEARTA